MKTTNDHRQALRLFAAGRDAVFITEALQLPAALVDEALGMAEHDVARAQQLVAAFDTRAQLVAAANGRPAPTRIVVPVQAKPVPTRSAAAAAATSATATATDQAPADEPAEPVGSTEPGGLQELLASASASSAARTRALGGKVRQLVDELRGRLAAEAAEAEVTALVAGLRQQLAEAETRLRQVRAGVVVQGGVQAGSPAAAATKVVELEDEIGSNVIRAWAAQAGVPCSARGPIAADVVRQWREATGRAA